MDILRPPKRTKELLKYAAPCIAEQLMLVLVGIISTAIVGHLGSAELTASSMSGSLVNWFQCFFTGLGTGVTVLVARFYGLNDKENIKTTFFHAFFITTLISIFVLFLLLIFQNQVIKLFFGNADENVSRSLNVYYGLCMLGMPATAATSSITAALRGLGDNRSAFYSTAVLNILNILLNYMLIYGVPILKIPAMGLRGAAIAVCLARYLALLYTAIYVILFKRVILPSVKQLKLDFGIAKRLFAIGIPSAFKSFLFQGGFVVLQSVLLSFGTVLQAGYQIGSQVNGINNAPSIALGVAMTSLISQQLGKQDYTAALEYVKAANYIVKTFFTALFIVMLAVSPWQAHMYTSEPEVIKSATFFVVFFALCVLPIGYMQTLTGILRGAGDVKYVTVSSVLALWFFRICTVLFLSHVTNNPYISVAIGCGTDFAVRIILYHIRVKKGHWLHIHV